MAIERLNVPEPNPHTARIAKQAGTEPMAHQPTIGTDQASFSGAKPATAHDPLHEPGHDAGNEADHHDASKIDDIAHKAHNPHGVLHLVEGGEAIVHAGARVVGRASRVAAAAAEVSPHAAPHSHGLVHKLEHWAEKSFAFVGRWLDTGIRKIPGGGKALDGARKLFRLPGKALGPGADKLLAGTRVGNAVTMTGSGSRFVGAMGGRLPIIGSVLGGIIAVADYRSALKIFRDPTATRGDKWIAGAQAGFSMLSGGAGVAALGIAGAAAIGLMAGPAIPFLLGFAAVTGLVAFGLSFFKKSTH